MAKPLKDRAFFRTILGKNKTGKIIHSIIDVMPVPNIHEVVKASAKANSEQTILELIKDTTKRVDATRTIIALAVGFAYLKGWIEIEQMKELGAFIAEFLKSM